MCSDIKSNNFLPFLHILLKPGSAPICRGIIYVMALGVSMISCAAWDKLIGLYGPLHHFIKTMILDTTS